MKELPEMEKWLNYEGTEGVLCKTFQCTKGPFFLIYRFYCSVICNINISCFILLYGQSIWYGGDSAERWITAISHAMQVASV